jgi:hypothetical protein
VTSWSLFEAASCGARLAISMGPATEAIVEANTACWVDLDDQQTLTQTLQKGLMQPGKAARILPGFELSTSLQRWEALLNRGLQSN